MKPVTQQKKKVKHRHMHRVKWCRINLWSRYDLHVVGHDDVLCKVKWWRFVTLFKWNWISSFEESLVRAIWL